MGCTISLTSNSFKDILLQARTKVEESLPALMFPDSDLVIRDTKTGREYIYACNILGKKEADGTEYPSGVVFVPKKAKTFQRFLANQCAEAVHHRYSKNPEKHRYEAFIHLH